MTILAGTADITISRVHKQTGAVMNGKRPFLLSIPNIVFSRLTLVVLVMSSTILRAQIQESNWERLPLGTEYSNLLSVAMETDTTGVAVGEEGAIRVAYGSRIITGMRRAPMLLWKTVDSPTRADLNAVTRMSNRQYVIVGNMGTILLYSTETSELETVQSNIIEDIISVDSRGDTVVVGGRNGGVYQSDDYGKNWLARASPTTDPIVTIGIGNGIWLASENELWMKHGSKSWASILNLQQQVDIERIDDVFVREDSGQEVVILSCDNAMILKSVDQGVTWVNLLATSSHVQTSEPVTSSQVSEDGRRLVFSTFNRALTRFWLYLSEDGGATWRNIGLDMPIVSQPSSMFITERFIVAVTDYGQMMTLSPNPEGAYRYPEFNQVKSTREIHSVVVNDGKVYAIGGYAGVVAELFTIDTGFTTRRRSLQTYDNADSAAWRYETGTIASNGEVVIAALSRNNGYEETHLVRSVDSGLSWQEILNDVTLDRYARVFSIGQTFLVIGTSGKPLVSTDNGVTWKDEQYDDQIAVPLPIAWMYKETTWVEAFATLLSSDIRYRITNDGGKTWNEIMGVPVKGLFAISETGRFVVVAPEWEQGSSPSHSIAISDDQGKTWRLVVDGLSSSNGEGLARNVSIRGSRIVVGGEFGCVLISNDNGSTWKVEPEATFLLDGDNVAASHILPDGRILLFGSNGQIVREKHAPLTSVETYVGQQPIPPSVRTDQLGYVIVETHTRPSVLYVDIVGRVQYVSVDEVGPNEWRALIPYSVKNSMLIVNGHYINTFKP